MKRRFITLIFVILILSTTTIFVGCGRDDEQAVDEQTVDEQVATEDLYDMPHRANRTSVTSIANGDRAIIHNDRIYYSYSRGFFSMNTDGSDIQMLSDVFAKNMHIVDYKIYFINGSYWGYIFSINIDGTNLRQLNNAGALGKRIIDGWIYYSVNGWDDLGIYKMRTDGSEQQQLTTSEAVFGFVVINDTIYYSTGTNLYKIRTDGSERQLLTSSEELRNFAVLNDIIYYGAWDGIYSIDVYGNNQRKINTTYAPWIFKVIDDWIFYIDFESNRVYRVRTNGNDQQRLTDNRIDFHSIYFIGNRIYYTSAYDGKIYSIKTDGSDRRQLQDDEDVDYIIIFSGTVLGHPVSFQHYSAFLFISAF